MQNINYNIFYFSKFNVRQSSEFGWQANDGGMPLVAQQWYFANGGPPMARHQQNAADIHSL